MNKFVLFAGYRHDPNGGMNDYKGAFDTIEEAQEHFEMIQVNEWGDIARITEEGLVLVMECRSGHWSEV